MVERNTNSKSKSRADKVTKATFEQSKSKPVSQTRFAKNLREAIVKTGLIECVREFCNLLLEAVTGVAVPERPVDFDIPEIDTLFTDIEVKEEVED